MKKVRQYLTGYAFVAPAGILVGLFGIFPVFFTMFVSLHKWRIKRGRFLAFDNFTEIFGSLGYLGILLIPFIVWILYSRFKNDEDLGRTVPGMRWPRVLFLFLFVGLFAFMLPVIYANGDADMFDSLRVTIWYSLGTVPFQLGFGLFLAMLLDTKFRGKQAFRIIFLLPYIVPTVAAAAVFERLFSLRPESFANQLLLSFGMEPLQWLLESKGVFTLFAGVSEYVGTNPFLTYWNTWAQGPSLALVSIMFFNWWVFVGYYALIFANGLSQIPKQMYEAAEIDGAKRRTVFFRIIIPMLSPTTFFLTMLGIIGTFKAFTHIYVLRNPAVRGAADPMSVHIFFTFFRKSRFGYAAAMSLMLFLIVLALTLVQRRYMERRVHYGD